MFTHTHTHTHTHTQLECTLKKPFLNHTHRAIQWNGGWCICSLVSLPLWNWIFVTHLLTSVVAISWEKLTPCSPYPVLEVPCILHRVISFHLGCSPSWFILLVRKPGRCSTSLIPRGVSHTFTLLPKPERHHFTPYGITWESLGGDQAPLLPPKGRSIIWTWVLTSLMGGAPN
jgi:hypothetical protein